MISASMLYVHLAVPALGAMPEDQDSYTTLPSTKQSYLYTRPGSRPMTPPAVVEVSGHIHGNILGDPYQEELQLPLLLLLIRWSSQDRSLAK
jgi:hypothetical protein